MPGSTSPNPYSPPARTGEIPAQRRAGGLLRAPKGEMTPVFTVLMTVTYIAVLSLLIVPHMITARTDSLWAEGHRVGFLGAAVFSGLVFGLLASVVAERRNHSAWWFLAGTLGMIAAPIVAASGMVESSTLTARLIVFGLGLVGTVGCFAVIQAFPRPTSVEPSVFTRALGRILFSCGNIWFGIGLLVFLTFALHLGTWWEDAYGPKSAQHMFYTSAWFGLLLLMFSASLIAATLRKYPFRVDQSGWIVTHIALVMIIIGSFMTFWGKEEGDIGLGEGESTSQFELATETRLKVDELRGARGRGTWAPVWQTMADFDLDPSRDGERKKFSTRYVAEEAGQELAEIEVDRYFADAKPLFHTGDDGPEARAAVIGDIGIPGGGTRPFELVEGDPRRSSQTLGEILQLTLYPLPYPLLAQALKGGRDRDGHGHLVVKTADGKELLRTPIVPGARGEASGAPADLSELDAAIPGTDPPIRVKGVSWYDRFDVKGPRDLAPGRPLFPAAEFVLSGALGDERRMAFAYAPSLSEEPGAIKSYKDLRVFLDYLPAYPLSPNQLMFVLPEGGEPFWVTQMSEGRKSGPLIAGTAIPLGIPLKITPRKIMRRFREWVSWELKSYQPARQVARVRVNDKEMWLPLGGRGDFFEKDGRRFRIRWAKTQRPLGFELSLRDFHRDFYPGTRQPSTFESYLWLTHRDKFPEPTAIKIDMNHPLRLDGWRLYQNRFSEESGETTFLEVNRDPGLFLLYPACIVLTLGLVIVFFQKPFLRVLAKWMKQKNMPAPMMFMGAVGKVAMTFAACLPGIILIVLIPEGPLLGLGVVLVMGGLVIETALVNMVLHRRLTRAVSSGGGVPTGAPA